MRFFLLISVLCLTLRAETITVHPQPDPKAIYHNPDMGWVLYENYPIDQDPHGSSTLLTMPGETFPDAAEIALMFSWADVEAAPDVYDFSKVDFAYDYWRKRAKDIQLRMSAETLLWWNTRQPPAGTGVPTYVVDKLPADKKQVRKSDGVAYTVVDAREPYYLERLAKFLDAVEKHYNKNRPVTLIDLRGFGLWGEWHTGYQYASVEDRHAALSGVLDCWSKHLPDHPLALSASFDPDSPKEYWSGSTKSFDQKFTTTYRDYLHYSAFDHALTLSNVTFRRDGVGGAVHSNERKLNGEAFKLGRAPMMSEFLGGYAAAKKGAPGWVEWLVDDALSLHPNYVNFLGWQGGDALDFIHERRDLIDKGQRTMGYRLRPTTVTYPATIKADEKFAVDMIWTNDGFGRALRDFDLVLTVMSKQDEAIIVETEPATVPSHEWVKEQESPATSATKLKKSVPAGEYDLYLALHDRKNNEDIGLPLADSLGRAYRIGTIKVSGK